MKIETKLRKKRQKWVEWLMAGDPVNGAINPKFEGIINHALEEHSLEAVELYASPKNNEGGEDARS